LNIPHIYARITKLEPTPTQPGLTVVLADGTSLWLNSGTYVDFEKLELDDVVLIDLSDWDDRNYCKLAQVFVFRRVAIIPVMNVITHFVIGGRFGTLSLAK